MHGARCRTIRALLYTLSPATVALAPLGVYERWVGACADVGASTWLAAVVSVALLGAARAKRIELRGPRLVGTAAFGVWLLAALFAAREDPGRGLLLLLAAVCFLAVLWPSASAKAPGPVRDTQPVAVSLAVVALAGLTVWQAGDISKLHVGLSLTLAQLVPLWLLSQRRGRMGVALKLLLGVCAALAVTPAVLALGALFAPLSADLSGLAALSALMLAVLAIGSRAPAVVGGASGLPVPGWFDVIMAQPSRVLVLSFVALCLLGTAALRLPWAAAKGVQISWLDAAFTAVSASCVTGLAVLDTPTTFSGLGQALVLLLIQVGGLGIMVFSASAALLMGRRLSLSHERAAVDLVGAPGRAGLIEAVRAVIAVTVLTELVGALALYPGFRAGGDTAAAAAWRALFTSISAFCNAGFALQSDSLVSYAGSPYVLTVIAVIIVVGGLGPAVLGSLISWRHQPSRTLHARLVLWTTAILVVVPALLICGIEWQGTLGGMSVVDKVANGVFQSVTLRTAGFNSVDLSQVHPTTWTVMVLVMFVGGSPGSTAGGAKTTTLAVIVLAIVAVVRGYDRVVVFGRTVSALTVMRATAITSLGVLSCCAALAAVQLTQTIPLDSALFEVVSALATVGLSTGATGQLDEVGKLIIMACMFAGRVGSLTVFMVLASHTSAPTLLRYPEEQVPIG